MATSTAILLSAATLAAAALGLLAWHVRRLFRGPDYARLPPHYPFKSEAARRRYQAYTDERARGWPAPAEARIVETAWGPTFVRSCGTLDAPPLVLLPSGFASSLIWLPNLPGLAKHFRVHAVDNIYDVGRSVNTRPVTAPEHLVDWLDGLLAVLEPARRVHLMGLSFGGWLASRYALAHPERLERVVLAAPAATLFPLPGAWAWRAILAALPPRRFSMTHFLVKWMCPGLAGGRDEHSRRLLDNWVDDAMMAMKCFTFRMPLAPTVLSDEELRSLRPPTLVAIGEREVVYPAPRAVARLGTVAPAIAVEVFPGVGHDLTIAATEAFNRTVVSFLCRLAVPPDS